MHSWIGLAVALCLLIFAFDRRCALRDSLDWRYKTLFHGVVRYHGRNTEIRYESYISPLLLAITIDA